MLQSNEGELCVCRFAWRKTSDPLGPKLPIRGQHLRQPELGGGLRQAIEHDGVYCALGERPRINPPQIGLKPTHDDGTAGIVEMAEFINSPAAGVFGALRNESPFRQVRIGLGAVTWRGELDLAPDAMHRASKERGTWVVR